MRNTPSPPSSRADIQPLFGCFPWCVIATRTSATIDFARPMMKQMRWCRARGREVLGANTAVSFLCGEWRRAIKKFTQPRHGRDWSCHEVVPPRLSSTRQHHMLTLGHDVLSLSKHGVDNESGAINSQFTNSAINEGAFCWGNANLEACRAGFW